MRMRRRVWAVEKINNWMMERGRLNTRQVHDLFFEHHRRKCPTMTEISSIMKANFTKVGETSGGARLAIWTFKEVGI